MVDCALRMPRLLFVRQCAVLAACIAFLVACSSAPPNAPGAAPSPTPSTKYYKDDGPGEAPPANLELIPDAMPRPQFYHPRDRGFEREIGRRLETWANLRREQQP